MEEFYSYFLEWGSMGVFAGYLVWSSIKQQKTEAERVASFQEQLDRYLSDYKTEIKEIRAESKEETERIRSKYEEVLGTYQDERTQVRQNISSRVREVGTKIDNLENEVRGIMINIENVITMMKEMTQEQKLRDLAKAAQVSRVMREKDK
tara:strand:- start:760 stop:1209 length:450 start_codon:yes stop_codon:yes gene_type:complete